MEEIRNTAVKEWGLLEFQKEYLDIGQKDEQGLERLLNR
jgi:hypothetical protein